MALRLWLGCGVDTAVDAVSSVTTGTAVAGEDVSSTDPLEMAGAAVGAAGWGDEQELMVSSRYPIKRTKIRESWRGEITFCLSLLILTYYSQS